MKKEKALIFEIEKFATNDGPGIRTVVFMKGCPLHCLWCHNPESQSFQAELLFHGEKCSSCRSCELVCPNSCHSFSEGKHFFDRKKCVACGKCEALCPEEALQLSGKEMSVDEVMEEVLKDEVFYRNSGGGLTLSGGEPLANFSYTEALLKAAKEKGLHTAVESCGFAPWEKVQELLFLVDLWLWDVKALPEKYEKLTGAAWGPIYENLLKVSENGGNIILRCPLVPGINDEEAHLAHIAELANTLSGVKEIHLEPYHPMGEGKSRDLGRENIFHAPFAAKEKKEYWREIITKYTSVPLHVF